MMAGRDLFAKQVPVGRDLFAKPKDNSIPNDMLPNAEATALEPMRQPTLQPERSLGEQAVGAGETALTLATGATGGVIGSIAGTAKGIAKEVSSGEFGTLAAAERIKQQSEQGAADLTYSPRTESGKEQLQATAETLSSIPPVIPVAAPLAATLAPAKLAAQSVLGKAFKYQTPFKRKISETLDSEPLNTDVVRYMKKGSGKVGKDKAAIEAINQGFDEGVIATIKGSSDADIQSIKSMVGIMKKAKKDAKFGAENRPTDMAGKNLVVLQKGIMSDKKKAGNAIENEASKLKGKFVDYSPAIDSFTKSLEDSGVSFSIGKKGRIVPNFRGSDFDGSKPAERLISKVIRRFDDVNPPTAHDVHRAKKFIDEQVSYGKKNQKALSGKAESIVKKLRSDLNNALGSSFEGYKLANEKYSKSISALDNFQKAVGTSVDLSSGNAYKSVGTSLRKLLSNTQSRNSLFDSIGELRKLTKESGRKINGDTLTQVLAADELDRMFGASARTSLKGQTEQAIQKGAQAVRGRTVADLAVGAASKLAEKARGINEDNAIKAFEALLRRNKGK